jgi:hypothetical protein
VTEKAQRKSVGILTFTRSVFQAFAMPTLRERATQKAHADMYSEPACLPLPETHGRSDKNISGGRFVALFSEGTKVAKF